MDGMERSLEKSVAAGELEDDDDDAADLDDLESPGPMELQSQ